MKRFTNNGKAVWNKSRSDPFQGVSSRRQQWVGHRDQGGFNRQIEEDGDLEGKLGDDHSMEEPVGRKLDRLLDRFDKLEGWRDETDRKFENLEPYLARDADPPLGFSDCEDLEDKDSHRRRS